MNLNSFGAENLDDIGLVIKKRAKFKVLYQDII